MNNMVLPHKVESDAITRNYGRFIISPLESGYGLTLGTALRRVLLSSLPGAAVTSLRVSDVHHEFSAIPNVREDMTQLILQVKQLRLHLFDTEQARLRLEHRAGRQGLLERHVHRREHLLRPPRGAPGCERRVGGALAAGAARAGPVTKVRPGQVEAWFAASAGPSAPTGLELN